MSHANEMKVYLEVEEDLGVCLERAYQYFLREDLDRCMKQCTKILSNHDHNNGPALYLLGWCFLQADRPGLAYTVLRRAVEIDGKRDHVWNALGRACQRPDQYDEAEFCFKQAVALSPNDPCYYVNLGWLALQRSQPEKAIELCQKAIDLGAKEIDYINCKDNMALAQLMLRRWGEGWDNYTYMLGRPKFRAEISYFGEPRWEGEQVGTIIIYGEQGLGDELLFSQCIPDLRRDAKEIIIDCDSRLEGLFQRSFPYASVYGTRREMQPVWREGHGKPEAHSAIGTLPRFYRRRDEDFRKEPWLKACPKRTKAFASAFETSKPRVGIAWTGGWKNVEKPYRSIPLERWKPILELDAEFVNLEYIDPRPTLGRLPDGFPQVAHFPWATLTDDYDDTAGLVASLDLVICVTTSVGHLAGSLGVPNWWFVPDRPNWRFGLLGDSLPWHDSKLYRQGNGQPWESSIHHVAEDLSAYLYRCRQATVGSLHSSSPQHSEPSLDPRIDYTASDRDTSDQTAWPDLIHLQPLPSAVATAL